MNLTGEMAEASSPGARGCRVLLIDNYDSYSFNLFHLLGTLTGVTPLLVQNDEFGSDWDTLVERLGGPESFDCIVIGPGPGKPQDERCLGLSAAAVLREDVNVPVLGVCLGMQAMVHLLGGQVRRAPRPMHGRLSSIARCGAPSMLFEGLTFPFSVVRYHSLGVSLESQSVLRATSVSEDDSVIMSLEHANRPLFGVQYHPESICSGKEGPLIVKNFLSFSVQSRHRIPASIKRVKAEDGGTEFIAAKPILSMDKLPTTLIWTKVDGCVRSVEETYERFFAFGLCRAWLDSAMQHPTRGTHSVLCGESERTDSCCERIEFYVENPRMPLEATHAELRDAGECLLVRSRPLNQDGRWEVVDSRRGKGCEPFSMMKESLNQAKPGSCLRIHIDRESGINNLRGTMDLELRSDSTGKEIEELPFDFQCGLVGTMGYGLRKLCGVKSQPDESTNISPHAVGNKERIPDLAFFMCDRSVVFDLESNTSYVMAVVVGDVSYLHQMDWMGQVVTFLTTSDAIACAPQGLIAQRSEKLLASEISTSDNLHSNSRPSKEARQSSSFDVKDASKLMKRTIENPKLPSLTTTPEIRAGFVSTGKRIILRPNRTQEEYEEDVRACLEKILEGETYEVCLTCQMEGSLLFDANRQLYNQGSEQTNSSESTGAEIQSKVDVDELYKDMRRSNPAPFGALFTFSSPCTCADINESAVTNGSRSPGQPISVDPKRPTVALLSTSPERFLRIDKSGLVESRPIKGTLPRGTTEHDDEVLKESLRNSEKDRAENLMIVDLVRNDLGRVCDLGSVHVPDLFVVESFRTVHQLVSTIQGQLKPGLTAVDAARAAFPPGSMTGAPKLRTMQVIDSIEIEERGFYSGALGFFSLNGSADLSVIIRTVRILDGARKIRVGAGGAVVALSDPEQERKEMELKVRALGSCFELIH